MDESGYKFNKTGFEIGSRFEYFDDVFKNRNIKHYERIETDNSSSRQQAQEGDYLDSFLLLGATYDKENKISNLKVF